LPVLYLVPFYCGASTDLVPRLADRLTAVFGVRVEQRRSSFDPEVAFDASRGQYNSRVLLAQMLRHAPDDSSRVLGVTALDLFIPVLTYVFGEAQLGGRVALVSTHRLDNAVYGLPPEPGLLFERLSKEAIHELGHTYSLVHCHDMDCVMTSSMQIDGVDLKSDRFCSRCERKMTNNGG
jgi:archaemetzincin